MKNLSRSEINPLYFLRVLFELKILHMSMTFRVSEEKMKTNFVKVWATAHGRTHGSHWDYRVTLYQIFRRVQIRNKITPPKIAFTCDDRALIDEKFGLCFVASLKRSTYYVHSVVWMIKKVCVCRRKLVGPLLQGKPSYNDLRIVYRNNKS